jgi:hypothetical protein
MDQGGGCGVSTHPREHRGLLQLALSFTAVVDQTGGRVEGGGDEAGGNKAGTSSFLCSTPGKFQGSSWDGFVVQIRLVIPSRAHPPCSFPNHGCSNGASKGPSCILS